MGNDDEQGEGVSAAEAVAQAATKGEAIVLAAVTAGDFRQAAALAARAHGSAIGRFCMALVGSQAEAEDLAQETLLAAYDGFGTWRGEGSLRAWLFGIARRRCAKHLEKRGRQAARLRLVHDTGRGATSEDLALARERAERARAALEAVRPSEREALVLRFVADLSFREVGDACGIDEATARKRVSRALARLRGSVSEE